MNHKDSESILNDIIELLKFPVHLDSSDPVELLARDNSKLPIELASIPSNYPDFMQEPLMCPIEETPSMPVRPLFSEALLLAMKRAGYDSSITELPLNPPKKPLGMSIVQYEEIMEREGIPVPARAQDHPTTEEAEKILTALYKTEAGQFKMENKKKETQ